ncbi:uncharacterized protein [Rhodnius prolixus]|uniref:uncharacterized protein n=1 Tax=Rhodnius prolixus TaxID=13249 RepID=UPI003D18C29D
MYGSETWALTVADESRLNCWERKVLRTIYGPIADNGVLRCRRNIELKELYKDADLVTTIKIGRLRWLGHLERMDRWRGPRKAFEGHPGGKRPRGRRRLRWLQDVEDDLQKMQIHQWRRKAVDRDGWSNLLKEAKVLQGP